MELKGKKINFLGDSITFGSGVADPENIFWNVIARENGAVCRGYGIGGTRIARKRVPSADPVFDQDFVSRVETMDPDADAVVVLGGTNDFGHGDAPLGRMEDRSPYTFYGAMHLLCQALLTRYPNAKLVIMTPLHRLSEDVTVNEIGLPLSTNLEGFVEIEKEVARHYGIPVLDAFAMSGMQPKVPVIQQMFMPDGLHPNDAGHKKMAELLTGFLRAL